MHVKLFSDKETALRAIENMNRIHASVGQQRGSHIPQWAYRDVLFMLIDYSIKAYELLERPLEISEKKGSFQSFLGSRPANGNPGTPGQF